MILDGILLPIDRIADRSNSPVRPRIFDGLAGMVHLRLAEAGHATPDIAWSGQPGLVLPEAWEKGMDDALDAAVADTPDTTPLRALLRTALTHNVVR
ncbi:hypothetical protein ACFV0T_25065 [Streptomyces sp. NPDC059582]|uniref:hypothetical protein n=1 Tax=Streptomyces sp. NPDC059582 TaxID=3346875 RepID=UPI0036BA25C5